MLCDINAVTIGYMLRYYSALYYLSAAETFSSEEPVTWWRRGVVAAFIR